MADSARVDVMAIVSQKPFATTIIRFQEPRIYLRNPWLYLFRSTKKAATSMFEKLLLFINYLLMLETNGSIKEQNAPTSTTDHQQLHNQFQLDNDVRFERWVFPYPKPTHHIQTL